MASAEEPGAGRVGAGVASARAALVGNPSDGYGGATLALALPERCAEVRASVDHQRTGSVEPHNPLVAAAARRFTRELAPHAGPAAIRWRTSIPRAVGLGGSSAIVISTLRALCSLHDLELEPAELARLALAIEVEDLGIVSGLQDRVAQAYGGLTFMDFESVFRDGMRHGRYESLDPSLLPPLFVAWRDDAGTHSGEVHGELRTRFEQGDMVVRSSMAELAELARRARAALLAGDASSFARCVDGSFEARQRMMRLDDRHVEMIECARAVGASANYTGSGGAIVGVCRDEAQRESALEALAAIGCTTLG